MTLTSGGTFSRWRRKRGRAARLRPVIEDAASTTRLFNGRASGAERRNGHAHGNGSDHGNGTDHGNGHGPPDESPSLHGRPAPVTIDEDSRADAPEATPVLRYEWRSSEGDTLVVEAGWPVREPRRDVERPGEVAGSGVDLRL